MQPSPLRTNPQSSLSRSDGEGDRSRSKWWRGNVGVEKNRAVEYLTTMFGSNTVFVIGAGASAEADMPLGAALTGEIAKLLSFELEFGSHLKRGDPEVYQAIRRLVQHQGWGDNQFIGSGRSVAEAMDLALSIDTFLESHRNNREFVKLGKLGIVRAISLAESRSLMRYEKNGYTPFRISTLSDTWYYSLARQLFTGVPADKPDSAFDNVSFVVFNYDRCLQTFLIRATENYFRLSRPEAEALISRVRIVHPYGTIGSVFSGSENFIPFGSQEFDINPVSDRIRTFSEACDQAAILQQWIFNAETVIFLGFGFHDQNVALLDISQHLEPGNGVLRRVFATTKGMSKSDANVVINQISYALRGEPEDPENPREIWTNDGSCADLFSTYWRSLTL